MYHTFVSIFFNHHVLCIFETGVIPSSINPMSTYQMPTHHQLWGSLILDRVLMGPVLL
jgi:hypothetical protein